MRLIKILPVFALATVLVQGCSSTTTPTPTPTPTAGTTVAFKLGTVYTFNQDKMTATTDVRDSSARDVITSTVIDTNASYGGKSGGVKIVVNSHSKAGTANDTSYYYQDGGNLFEYNYGLAALNADPTFQGYLGGKPLNVGWVLLAKPGTALSTIWTAVNDDTLTLHVSTFTIPTKIVDNATLKDTSTMMVNGKPQTAWHTVHTVVASANTGAGFVTVATITIDSYITVADGSVLNIAHTFNFTPPGSASTAVAGQYTVLTNIQ